MDRRDLQKSGSDNLFERLFLTERSARIAILYERHEITYGGLRDQTVRVAERLNTLGVGAGDRVGILLGDSPEFITSLVAIVSLGAIVVPINLALRREDQLFILKDCGAGAAIIEASAMQALIGEADRPAELKEILVVRREADSQISSITCIN